MLADGDLDGELELREARRWRRRLGLLVVVVGRQQALRGGSMHRRRASSGGATTHGLRVAPVVVLVAVVAVWL